MVRVRIYLQSLCLVINTSRIYTIDTEISFVAEFNLDLISVSNRLLTKLQSQ